MIASEHFPWLEKEKKIGVFLQNIFWKKKGATHFRLRYETFIEEFAKTNWVFEFLSENSQFQKKKSSETESRS
jgi:hypothetical protein